MRSPYIKTLFRKLTNPPLWLSLGLFAGFFIISRLWFFIDFPLPLISGDSHAYHKQALEIVSGQLPEFTIRSPGYSLLLALVYLLYPRLMGLVGAQNLIALISGMILIVSFYKLHPILSFGSALAMLGYTTSVEYQFLNMSMLTESLYVSCLLMWFGFLLLGYNTKKNVFFVISSILAGYTIWVRPSGLFLVVLYLLVLGFLIWNRRSHSLKSALGFGLPLPLMILSLALYNGLKSQMFSLSAYGPYDLAGATFHLWETDAAYPDYINATIEDIQAQYPPEIKLILTNPHNPDELQQVFMSYYSKIQTYSNPTFVKHWRGEQAMTLQDLNEWMKRAAIDSIIKHPDRYWLFVKTQLEWYYLKDITSDPLIIDKPGVVNLDNFNHKPVMSFSSITDYIQTTGWLWYINKTYSVEKGSPYQITMAREYAIPPFLKNLTIDPANMGVDGVTVHATFALKLYGFILRVRNVVFAGTPWVYVNIVLFFYCIVRLIAGRFRDDLAFLIILLILGNIGASIITCLVEIALTRYSYTMEWTYYLTVVLAVMMFGRNHFKLNDNRVG